MNMKMNFWNSRNMWAASDRRYLTPGQLLALCDVLSEATCILPGLHSLHTRSWSAV